MQKDGGVAFTGVAEPLVLFSWNAFSFIFSRIDVCDVRNCTSDTL